MLISEVDRNNWASPAAMVAIAEHAGMKPIEVASIASSYMYLPREKQGEHIVYVCNCLHC